MLHGIHNRQDNKIKYNTYKNAFTNDYIILQHRLSIHDNSWQFRTLTDSHGMAFFILNDIHDNTSHNILMTFVTL